MKEVVVVRRLLVVSSASTREFSAVAPDGDRSPPCQHERLSRGVCNVSWSLQCLRELQQKLGVREEM